MTKHSPKFYTTDHGVLIGLDPKSQIPTNTGFMVSSAAVAAAFVSTATISLVPNVILFLFPSYAEGEGGNSLVLTLGQAMSAGGLLGDVFLHTVPHAPEDAGIWILVGFLLFFASDLVIRSLDSQSNADDKHKHNHSHSPSNKTVTTAGAHRELHRSTVYLNLAADALHNFTDGLAIGATYAMYTGHGSVASLLSSRGGLASISVLFHEVPHELGDFCTLVRAGCSKRQALMAQFTTAVAAFLGTAVALAVAGWESERLLYITAGGFIYLAATTLLPEVLQPHEEQTGGTIRLLQFLSFLLGLAFLYAVAYLEEYDEHSHHHHHHHHHQPSYDHYHDHHHGHQHSDSDFRETFDTVAESKLEL